MRHGSLPAVARKRTAKPLSIPCVRTRMRTSMGVGVVALSFVAACDKGAPPISAAPAPEPPKVAVAQPAPPPRVEEVIEEVIEEPVAPQPDTCSVPTRRYKGI